MKDENIEFTIVDDDLFEILGIPDERARVDLTSMIIGEIRSRGLTRAQAAKLLGLEKSEFADLMRLRIEAFSEERLEQLLNSLDQA
jgi:predicted XRE-type DNA-binding protein